MVLMAMFDPAKRAKVLAKQGLDLAHADQVFDGFVVEEEGTRTNYGMNQHRECGFWKPICWFG